MNTYSEYTTEQLEAYVANTRANAAQFDKEGNYFQATVHYSEAMRALYALAKRNTEAGA